MADPTPISTKIPQSVPNLPTSASTTAPGTPPNAVSQGFDGVRDLVSSAGKSVADAFNATAQSIHGVLDRVTRGGGSSTSPHWSAGRGSLLPARTLDPWAFRSPVPPWPVEVVHVAHPDVPLGLDGLSILQVTDLHIRRPQRDAGWRTLLDAVRRTPADLVVYTGDYHDDIGDEHAAAGMLGELAAVARPRIAQLGIFGNHDTPRLRQLLQARTGITWLNNRVTERLTADGRVLPLRVMGLSFPEDPLAAALTIVDDLRGPAARRPLVLTLAHMPSVGAACADLGLSIVFAGHTHGGQVRLSPSLAPHTASDLPYHMPSGILRLRQTLICISRGVGDGVWPGLRINCPWQMPLYVLRRGVLPMSESANATTLASVRGW